MGKVRDGLLNIRKISALSIRDNFVNSQNQPFLIKGIDTNSGKSDYFVLKPTVGLRMYGGAAMRELIASLIAIELDIPVPEPVIVDISEEFNELYRDKVYYEILNSSIGNNFGTLYLDGLSTWTDAHYQNKLLFNPIQSIFVFDTFIENADRNANKPNMLVGDDNIFLIDHEIAFSFADLILYNNATPWILTENDCTLARQHLFFNFLKGKQFCSDNLIQKMANIDVQFWDVIESYLPLNWKHEKFDTIKNFILQRVSNLEEFQNEIERVLI